jgi:hypothetical protein
MLTSKGLKTKEGGLRMFVKRTVLIVIGLLLATGATAHAQAWGPEENFPSPAPAGKHPSAPAPGATSAPKKTPPPVPRKKDTPRPKTVIVEEKATPSYDEKKEEKPAEAQAPAQLPPVPELKLNKPPILDRPDDVLPLTEPEPTPPPKAVETLPSATPSPEPEKAKEPEKLSILEQRYFMPYIQGGLLLGWSPTGDSEKPMQVGRTTSWFGASGGVESEHCHFDKNGRTSGFCLIGEYRVDAYLDRPTVEMRELFLGGRLHSGLFGMFLRLGAEEDIGETTWAYRPGSVADVRNMLRDTFGHPGASAIGGLSLGNYFMVRGEGNAEKEFYAARVDAHVPIVFSPWVTLNLDFDAGFRSAKDEMGKVKKIGFGIKPEFKMVFTATADDGKPAIVDWGRLRPAVHGLCERQSDLVATDKVGKEVGAMHNGCVGQAGLAWKGPSQASVHWQNFLFFYSYGRYFPLEQKHGGYSSVHLEQKTEFKAAKLSLTVFGSAAYVQNLGTLYKVPLLVSDGSQPYWIIEFGARVVFNDLFQFDAKWPY